MHIRILFDGKYNGKFKAPVWKININYISYELD